MGREIREYREKREMIDALTIFPIKRIISLHIKRKLPFTLTPAILTLLRF